MDLVKAVADYLREQDSLANVRVLTRPYVARRDGSRPLPYVVLKQSGDERTVGSSSYVPYMATVIDAQCYGATPRDCRLTAFAVKLALKNLRTKESGDMLLYSATDSGGPIDGIESQTGWYYTFISMAVRHDERTVAERSMV